jgi:hypothetical protein
VVSSTGITTGLFDFEFLHGLFGGFLFVCSWPEFAVQDVTAEIFLTSSRTRMSG